MSFLEPNFIIPFTKRFNVEFTTVKEIPTTLIESNALELLKFKLTKPAGALDMGVYQISSFVMSEMRRLTGAGTIRADWQSSVDGITWGVLLLTSTTNASFERDADNQGSIFQFNDRLFYRLALFNSNGTTSGEIKNLQFFTEIVLPAGYLFERLI